MIRVIVIVAIVVVYLCYRNRLYKRQTVPFLRYKGSYANRIWTNGEHDLSFQERIAIHSWKIHYPTYEVVIVPEKVTNPRKFIKENGGIWIPSTVWLMGEITSDREDNESEIIYKKEGDEVRRIPIRILRSSEMISLATVRHLRMSSIAVPISGFVYSYLWAIVREGSMIDYLVHR